MIQCSTMCDAHIQGKYKCQYYDALQFFKCQRQQTVLLNVFPQLATILWGVWVSLMLANSFTSAGTHLSNQYQSNIRQTRHKNIFFAQSKRSNFLSCKHSSGDLVTDHWFLSALYAFYKPFQIIHRRVCAKNKLSDVFIRDECVRTVKIFWKITYLIRTGRQLFVDLLTYLCQRRIWREWNGGASSNACQLHTMCSLVSQHLMNNTLKAAHVKKTYRHTNTHSLKIYTPTRRLTKYTSGSIISSRLN